MSIQINTIKIMYMHHLYWPNETNEMKIKLLD